MTHDRTVATAHAEHDETRRAILEAARRLFMQHGYRAVSTRRVAEACGLTQPALYHHFSGKEDLYVAVLVAEVGRLRGGLERIARRDEPVPARLRQAAHFMLLSTDYDFALMQHDMRAELGAAAQGTVSAAFVAGVVGPLAGLIVAGQRAGDLPEPLTGDLPPQAAAFLFLSLIAHVLDGPVNDARGGPGRTEATAALVVELLLHGLTGARPREERAT